MVDAVIEEEAAEDRTTEDVQRTHKASASVQMHSSFPRQTAEDEALQRVRLLLRTLPHRLQSRRDDALGHAKRGAGVRAQRCPSAPQRLCVDRAALPGGPNVIGELGIRLAVGV